MVVGHDARPVRERPCELLGDLGAMRRCTQSFGQQSACTVVYIDYRAPRARLQLVCPVIYVVDDKCRPAGLHMCDIGPYP